MVSLQHIYQDLWEMDPVSYRVFVIHQAKHMQLSSTYAQKKKKKKKKKNSVSFIFSKARSAHKKKLTIPRLEFMSVLIGARSLHFVAKAMRFENAE